jgi:tripartite-type tricarboxylate transporter receptor subunit TctC
MSMTVTRRRSVLRGIAVSVAAVGILAASVVAGQAFPERPIKLIVPFAPGTTDQAARALARGIEAALKQPVIVENRAGAGGAIGANFVAKANPDGYTLLYSSTAPLTIVPLISEVQYKLDDLTPIAQVMASPHLVAARVDAPFHDVEEMIAYGRANPGKINFGSSGTGSAVHLAGMAFAKQAGIKVTHVPYQGLAPAITAVRGGFVDFVVGLPIAIQPQIDAGAMRAIVQLGATRSPSLPDVPTATEKGIKIDLSSNMGVFAPRGTPTSVMATLANAIETTMQSDEWHQFVKNNHEAPLFAPGPQMKRKLDAERDFMAGLVKEFEISEKY